MFFWKYNHTTFLGLLGLFWKIVFVKFHENGLRIDWKISENHALLVNSRPEYGRAQIWVTLGMKGCICHFGKWQIHPFISKGTTSTPYIYSPTEQFPQLPTHALPLQTSRHLCPVARQPTEAVSESRLAQPPEGASISGQPVAENRISGWQLQI